jgi:hypothetical protein
MRKAPTLFFFCGVVMTAMSRRGERFYDILPYFVEKTVYTVISSLPGLSKNNLFNLYEKSLDLEKFQLRF